MKRFFTIVFLTMLVPVLTAQQTLREFVYFNPGQHTLTIESKNTIDAMLTEIASGTILKIELYGHSDGSGDTTSNKLLAQKRVESVRAYLLTIGMQNSVIVSGAYGEEFKAFDETTPEDRKRNRRVEVAITYD